MPKVLVEAQEDFFDRANQRPRKKGEQFQLKDEYAKTQPVKVLEKVKHVPLQEKTSAPVTAKAKGGPTAKRGK